MSEVKDLLKQLQHIRKQRDQFIVGDNKVQKAVETFVMNRHRPPIFLIIILLITFLIFIF